MRVACGIAAHKGACGNARVPGGRSAWVRVSGCFSYVRRRGLPARAVVRASGVSLGAGATVLPLHRWSSPLRGTVQGVRAADVQGLPRGTGRPFPVLALVRGAPVYTTPGGCRRHAGVSMSCALAVQLVLASCRRQAPHVVRVLWGTGPFPPSARTGRDRPVPTESKVTGLIVLARMVSPRGHLDTMGRTTVIPLALVVRSEVTRQQAAAVAVAQPLPNHPGLQGVAQMPAPRTQRPPEGSPW